MQNEHREENLVLKVKKDVLKVPFGGTETEECEVYRELKALFLKYSEEAIIDALQQFYARRAADQDHHLRQLYLPIANVLTEVYHRIV